MLPIAKKPPKPAANTRSWITQPPPTPCLLSSLYMQPISPPACRNSFVPQRFFFKDHYYCLALLYVGPNYGNLHELNSELPHISLVKYPLPQEPIVLKTSPVPRAAWRWAGDIKKADGDACPSACDAHRERAQPGVG